MNRTLYLLGCLVLFFLICLIYLSTQSEQPYRKYSSKPYHDFVGEQVCVSCHRQEVTAWKGSHHDYAMAEATEQTVQGDFSDVIVTHGEETYRFFRRKSLYMVEVSGPEEERDRYQVTHTFGWTPLQQYLIDFGKGKLQALNIAWNTEQEQWFVLNPNEEIKKRDWLHWSGGAMNWNTMCADCHSTNLQQNYIASVDSFNTTWSSIDVSCEACHGPGGSHVEFMRSEQANKATIKRIRQDLKLTANASQEEQINQCAQCHSLREELTENYNHEGDFLDNFNPTLPHPESYFADGQIKGEVYVYGSFLQSKMFKYGVKCNDCHDPHTLNLKANVTDNSLCLQCHVNNYNSPSHHFHKPNTEASQCINCHMPGRYYMEVDFRRDHSFRVPRPDLSKTFDTPNACNNCHEDRSAEWAAESIEKWYGDERANHSSEILLKANSEGSQAIPALEQLISDTSTTNLIRATAAWYLGQFSTEKSITLLQSGLDDSSGLVRKSAVRALSSLGETIDKPLLLAQALDDSLRSVRLGAAYGLAEFTAADMPFNVKRPFNDVIREYKNYLDVSQYFPHGQMNRAQFLEKQGQIGKAINAYNKALKKDPHFNAARMNLAYLYNRQGNNAEAEKLLRKVIYQEPEYGPVYYSLALLLAEQGKLEEALPYFKQAAEWVPENSRIYYNWAIALQTLGHSQTAEKMYKRAIGKAPNNTEYRYGICTLYLQEHKYKQALKEAQKLSQLQPNNPDIQNLLQVIKSRLSNQ